MLFNMRQAWGVVMVKKWITARKARYTVYANHSVDVDGFAVHYIDNRRVVPVRIKR